MPSICSGAPGPLTLCATIKDAGSRGSKMIMIASVRQKRSWELYGKRANQGDKDARAICLCKVLSARDPGVPVFGLVGAEGHEPLPPGAPAASGLSPSPAPRGATRRAERGGGWGVDVIGADAAVSSIMDGDDADRGAEPVGRGERNRNRERKERGRETHPVTHARVRIYTYTLASHCHSGIHRRAAHTQAHAHALSPRHTPAGGDAGATHTHQWLFLIFTHTGLEADTWRHACMQLGHTQA